MKPSIPEQFLTETLAFTADDLEANRAGQLSENQRKSFANKRRLWTAIIWLVIGSCFLWSLAIVFSDIYGSNLSSKLAPLTTTIILFSGIGLGSWYKRRQYDLDLKSDIVSSVEGVPSLASFARARSYTVHIQDEWFAVNSRVFSAFRQIEQDKMNCRFYYAPKCRTVLSVERLAK